MTGYFVYNAGGPTWPPTLSLLSTCRSRRLRDPSATGLLRRGEDDLVVAELRMLEPERTPTPTPPNKHSPPELLVFRSGEWCVRRPRIVSLEGGEHAAVELSSWRTNAVVPLGGLLCWASFGDGLLLCDDVLEEKPTLRYVPYPVEAVGPYYCRRRGSFLCIDPRGGALNLSLVNVTRRRCSQSQCGCSEHSRDMDIRTWTLRTTDDDVAWVVKDGTDDSAELWTLECWPSGFARVHLLYPLNS
ncbi:hypothetical protein QOZ80_6BG0497250 [Eleusine coracana subsp. coracana]|nr:hypothetical protein QOZ80_6BG0497250 [Eleusine coracana subsp. coracana]